MADLVQLEEKLFVHDFQRTHFPRVLLLRKEDLSIAALTDLRKDLKVAVPEPYSTLAQSSTLSPGILLPQPVVFRLFCLGWRRYLGSESLQTILPGADIGKKVEVVV